MAYAKTTETRIDPYTKQSASFIASAVEHKVLRIRKLKIIREVIDSKFLSFTKSLPCSRWIVICSTRLADQVDQPTHRIILGPPAILSQRRTNILRSRHEIVHNSQTSSENSTKRLDVMDHLCFEHG